MWCVSEPELQYVGRVRMSSVPGVIGSERPQESSLLLLPPAKAQQKVEQQEAAEPSEQRDISSSDEAVVDYSGEYDEEEEEEEEEVVMDEEEMLRMLDQVHSNFIRSHFLTPSPLSSLVRVQKRGKTCSRTHYSRQKRILYLHTAVAHSLAVV